MKAAIKDTPIDSEIVNDKIKDLNVQVVGKATIREIKRLVDNIESASGKKFIRMEMGVPGLPPAQVGTDAEIEALQRGVAAIYPDIDGIPILKKEVSLFVKNFLPTHV